MLISLEANISRQKIKNRQKHIIELIEQFDILGWKANVRLENPERQFAIYENKKTKSIRFGKIIGKRVDQRDDHLFYSKYDLRDRKYLGPTSTATNLSFIMVNLLKLI